MIRALPHLAASLAAVAAAASLLFPSSAFAQQAKSAALATELARLLGEAKLESVAAKSGEQFVAAYFFPGTLMVVTARFTPADQVNQSLARKAYKDVYIDLNGTSDQQSKTFVTDHGADGLRRTREGSAPFDTVDVGRASYSFDGDWQKAKLSQEDYTRAFEKAEEQYTKMLEALIGALKQGS